MDKLIIVSVYVVVVILAIVVLIIKNIKLKKALAKRIEKLERDKNLVLSTPILNELSKAESLVKDDKTKVRFDEWQEKFDNIRNNDIPEVTDMLLEADNFIDKRNKCRLRLTTNIRRTLPLQFLQRFPERRPIAGIGVRGTRNLRRSLPLPVSRTFRRFRYTLPASFRRR